jgi:thiol-disulfide isomerase/thioredoxin
MSCNRFLLTIIIAFSAFGSAAQEVEIIRKSQLDALMSPSNVNDTSYVINFWATWCKPCVKELPYFEKLNRKYEDKKVRVILISLDFKRNLDSHLISFIRKNNIQSEVVLLDEPDYNSWINDVSSEWSGAIPATVFIKGSSGIKNFHEKEFTYDELVSELKKLN